MQACDRWLEQYYGKLDSMEFSLLDRATRTLLSNVLISKDGKPLPWHPHRGISPSQIGFRGIWNWDTAFHAVGVAHWDVELAREQIQMFLGFQKSNGMLPDVIFESGEIVDDVGKPPLMPWAAMVIDQRCHDLEFVRAVYPAFVKYEKFWRQDRGGKEHGLFNYDSAHSDPETRLIHTKYESGWDNSVRWDTGIHELWPIDLNCYMIMLYNAMSYFAAKLDLPEDIVKWEEKKTALTALIEQKLWDKQSQAYLDYDFGTGNFIQALTPASFMPLYAEIASPERAALMAKIGGDHSTFSPGWPTVAYDHPAFDPKGYWRGRTWLNVAYFALKGLKNCGYDGIADEGRNTLVRWVSDNPGFIYENYHPQSGLGLGVPQFSWSAVFVIEFILNWEDK